MTVMLPQGPEDLSASWLTERFHESGLLDDNEAIDAVRPSIIGTEYGFTSTVVRLDLSSAGAAVPKSVVVKLASPKTIRASMAAADERVHRMISERCIREALFFEEIAARVPSRIPRCYGAWTDADAFTSVLLFEDVVGEQGDAVIGATPDETAAIIQQISRLHAATWGADDLPAWLPVRDPDPRAFGDRFLARRPVFLDHFGERLDAEERALVESLDVTSVRTELAARPQCVIHGDLHLDNVIFERPGCPVILDWQSVARGHAAIDLAFLVSEPPRHSTMPADVGARLDELTTIWHAAMNVPGYSYLEASHDLRLGMLRLLAGVVCGFSNLDPETCVGRERLLLDAYFERALLFKSLLA